MRNISCLTLVLMLLAGCTAGNRNVNEDPVVYRNSRYGFTFDLPASWKGYKIIEKKWEGITTGGKRLKNGAVIIIRHPLWTKETPRQDIPVMIFTHDDFKRVQDETMSVSAAPVPPTELGVTGNTFSHCLHVTTSPFPKDLRKSVRYWKGNRSGESKVWIYQHQ